MTQFRFYDDIADETVTITADSYEQAMLIIEHDYGTVYAKHMHRDNEEAEWNQ